jgi:hypothetical protein
MFVKLKMKLWNYQQNKIPFVLRCNTENIFPSVWDAIEEKALKVIHLHYKRLKVIPQMGCKIYFVIGKTAYLLTIENITFYPTTIFFDIKIEK